MNNTIREFQTSDIDAVMKIWLDEVVDAHDFIDRSYWHNSSDAVKSRILNSKCYVYQNNEEIQGFVSLSGNYIQYLFVKSGNKRTGIGKSLLKFCKNIFWCLMVKVYENNTSAVGFFEEQLFYTRDRMNNAETQKCELCMEWNRQ